MAVIAPHWTQFDGVTSTVDRAVLGRAGHLVHLRGAHVHPRLRDLARDRVLDPDVARRVVARLVSAQIDARELVERQLAVGRRVLRGAVADRERRLGVALELRVPRREMAAVVIEMAARTPPLKNPC